MHIYDRILYSAIHYLYVLGAMRLACKLAERYFPIAHDHTDIP